MGRHHLRVQDTRRRQMELYTRKEECCGCGACGAACPSDAIHMAWDREGFLYPRIDDEKCIGCKRCEQVCPVKQGGRKDQDRLYLGVQAKDDALRYASSSGGMFPVLASYVFERRGVVYGAAYTKDMRVAHREARNMEELEKIKKTKYVQSNLRGVYRRIESHLKKDRWVLFCGTPCQAQALRLYLGRSYDRLLTADLVCYGVPSPGIWKSYVRYLERKKKGKMTDFSFRDKRGHDNGHVCSYVIGGTEYADKLNSNLYCRMYFANDTVRPSCYSCKYCTPDRNSDFTIGDFWGIENVKPEMDDGMGTSMVIVHTEKGREVWDAVKEKVSWFVCEREDVLQPRLLGPTAAAKNRGYFMKCYRMLPFSLFAALFLMISFIKDVQRRIRGWGR